MQQADNDFGIFNASFSLILDTLKKEPKIHKAYIFGSRAIGTYKTGSDIDIVIEGEKLNLDILTSLADTLNEELPIPYYVDLLIYHQITNSKLKEHIDNKCVLFYSI